MYRVRLWRWLLGVVQGDLGDTGEVGKTGEVTDNVGRVMGKTDQLTGEIGEVTGETGELGKTGEVTGETGEVLGHSGELGAVTGELGECGVELSEWWPASTKQRSNRRSGLTAELYKVLQDIVTHNMLEVFTESVISGCVPARGQLSHFCQKR